MNKLLLIACGVLLAGRSAGEREPPMVSGAPEVCESGDGQLLHVPSPDWRDQVIYMLFIDRFDDGDPGNNDRVAGEATIPSWPRISAVVICRASSTGSTT